MRHVLAGLPNMMQTSATRCKRVSVSNPMIKAAGLGSGANVRRTANDE
jgi:hypothetical protein